VSGNLAAGEGVDASGGDQGRRWAQGLVSRPRSRGTDLSRTRAASMFAQGLLHRGPERQLRRARGFRMEGVAAMKFGGLFGKALIGLVVLFGVMTGVLGLFSTTLLDRRLTAEYETKGKAIVQGIASFSDEILLFRN